MRGDVMKEKLFSPENPINGVLSRIFDLFILNLLWLLCCVPVVTIGASTAAMYSLTLGWMERKEKPVVRGFFRALKENMKQGIVLSLLLILAAGIFLADFHILGRQEGNLAGLAYGFCIILLLAVVSIFSYVFPLVAKFENTLVQTFKNAWRLAASHLLSTLAVVLINSLPFLWFLIHPASFSAVFFLWLVIGGSLSAWFCSFFMTRIFRKLIQADS